MENIIENNILQQAGNIRGKEFLLYSKIQIDVLGNIFTDPQKFQEASKYKDHCYKIYLLFCTKNKVRFEKYILGIKSLI